MIAGSAQCQGWGSALAAVESDRVGGMVNRSALLGRTTAAKQGGVTFLDVFGLRDANCTVIRRNIIFYYKEQATLFSLSCKWKKCKVISYLPLVKVNPQKG